MLHRMLLLLVSWLGTVSSYDYLDPKVGYSYWDEGCSFIYESNNHSRGLCSPLNRDNTNVQRLNHPCGFPLTAPLSGYCNCSKSNLILAFCPQNVPDPAINVPYQRSCQQLCGSRLKVQNNLANATFSEPKLWRNSTLSTVVFNSSGSGRTVTSCQGTCQMAFSATYNSIGADANLQFEFRFSTFSRSNCTVQFCSPASRPDVYPDCTTIMVPGATVWQSHVVASGALSNPGSGPFPSNSIVTRDGFTFLIQTSSSIAYLDDPSFWVTPELQQILVLNQFSSTASADKPEPESSVGPSSIDVTDITPAIIIGNSSEHEVDIYYCRALFYDPPVKVGFVEDFVKYYDDFELSSWESSHFHVSGSGRGVSDGRWTLSDDEKSEFGNFGNTSVSCMAPTSIFNETNSYNGLTTLCHAFFCGECPVREPYDYGYDDYGGGDTVTIRGAFTIAAESVASCKELRPNFYDQCNPEKNRILRSSSKRVNPLQDNTLDVSQRSNHTFTKPFAVPHPLRGTKQPIVNENYVYIGLEAAFRLRSSNFLGFYSASIQNIGESLGFATLRDYNTSLKRIDSNFSVLRKNTITNISVDIVHNGIGLQCFGKHVPSSQPSNSCHINSSFIRGYAGAKNIICTAFFDDRATCIDDACIDPQSPRQDFIINQTDSKAKAFDAFQCQGMCTSCSEGWLDYPIVPPNGSISAKRASPRGEPADADLILQVAVAASNLCLKCPTAVIENESKICSDRGSCSRDFSTSRPACICDKDIRKRGFYLYGGESCEKSAMDNCNYGLADTLGGHVGFSGSLAFCECSEAKGYQGPSCSDCMQSYYHPAGFNKVCLKCDETVCDPRHGFCDDGLSAMPWGGGCLLNQSVKAALGPNRSHIYECVASFPAHIAVAVGTECILCNPELNCGGQSCNTSLAVPNAANCICDSRHTGDDCSECQDGYYGPDCLPCPFNCHSPNGRCIGNLSSSPCECNSRFLGPFCQYSDEGTCNGHGKVLDNGVCDCHQDLGWSGETCSECTESEGWYLVDGRCQRWNNGLCEGRGVFSAGVCVCDTGLDSSTNCTTCLPNYFPAGVCSITCTNLTCNNHGACDSNGQCICGEGFIGKNCEKCNDGSWLSGFDCIPCAGNPPCGGSSTGICSMTGMCQCNENYRGDGCADPVILEVQVALRKLTIFGNFLALASFVQLSGEGVVNCTVTDVSDHLDCDCPLLNPDGRWMYSIQVFASNGRQSQVFYQQMSLPVITSGPSNAIPTGGGVNITLVGSNFGITRGVVLMTDTMGVETSIFPLQQNNMQIIFLAGAGVGVSAVRVKIGNVSSQNAASISYLAPVITSISAGSSTKGQTNVILQGENFGLYPSLVNVMFENGASCVVNSNCTFSHFRFCCSAPPGFGKTKVNLTVASRASVELIPQYYVYDAPQIAAVMGCPNNVMNGTVDCDPRGGTRITVIGTNFGDALSLIGPGTLSVSIGGAPCLNLSLTPHVSISCVLPAGGGTSNMVQVKRVGRITQVGSAPLLSYAGPSLSPLTIKIASLPVASIGAVNDTSTRGGLALSFGGRGFPTVPDNFRVRYGPASSPGAIGWQNCLVNAVTPNSFNCTTAPGVGKNLVFRVTLRDGDTSYSSDLSSDVYSYPSPTLTSGSIGGSFGSRSASYTSQVASGELIFMSGTSLGTQPALVKVFYGPTNSLCAVQTVNETELSCIIGPGSGMNYTFRVEVGYGASAQAASGTDQFSFSVVPVISSIIALGCGNPPNACPTDAVSESGSPILLTINGTNLGQAYEIFVGDQVCRYIQASDAVLSCHLPKGTGRNNRVLLLSSYSQVTATTSISYAAPTVASVSGCVDSFPNTFECSRIGARISVRGANFGMKGARVLVGGQECFDVSHNESTSLTCSLPTALSSSRLAVRVLQNGQISTPNVYITQMPCLPGFEDRTGSCSQCDVGSFSLGSQCVPCNRGSVASKGASICRLCETGRFSDYQASVCSNCDPGRSMLAPGQIECENCPIGRYSAGGDGSCVLCSLGTHQASLGTACSLYSPRFVPNATQGETQPSHLSICSPGMFAFPAGASVCSLCAPGKFSVSTRNFSQCTDCEAGRFQQSAGQSTCAQCPEGLFSTTASTKCHLCSAGRVGLALGSGCTDCVMGTYAPIPGLRKCLGCSKGKYSNYTGLVLCVDCPIGRFNNNSMQTACISCPSKSFAGYAATACAKCDLRQSMGQSTCTACEPGKYLSSNMTCLACSPGKASKYTSQTVCEHCGAGRYANVSGASVCNFCSLGYFASSTTECTKCPSGRSSKRGELSCSDCTPGRFATAGSTSCLLCSPGSYSVLYGATTCFTCDPNSFSSLLGAEACLPCSPGRFADTKGSSFCGLCSPGKFSRGTGHPCIDCLRGFGEQFKGFCNVEGTHAPRYGATSCLACPPLWCSGWNSALAEPDLVSKFFDTSRCFPPTTALCRKGQYVAAYLLGTDSLSPCKPCPAGKFREEADHSIIACDSCLDGYYNNGNSTKSDCVACNAGEYSDGIECIPCASGRFASRSATSRCALCSPGRFSPSVVGFSACEACPAGTFSYQTSDLQVICKQCVSGRYSSQPGQVACRSADSGFQVFDGSSTAGGSRAVECPAGTFHSVDENVYSFDVPQPCNECLPGFFSEKAAAICLSCPAGYYTNVSGSSSCLPCPIGEISVPGAANCILCEPGTEPDVDTCRPCLPGFFRNTSLLACVPCSPGYFASVTNHANCVACSPGSYTLNFGTIKCEACSRGRFQSSSGSTNCIRCPPGSQSKFETAAEICTSCDPGSFANSSSLVCIACSEGRYSNYSLPQNCSLCAPGTFAPAGQGTCSECPNGSYQSEPGMGSCVSCLAGTVSNKSKLECIGCDIGKISVNASECAPCPAGSSSSRMSSTVCNPCEINEGTLINENNATICRQCVENARPNLETSSCKCIKGYYQAFTTRDLSRAENLMNGTGDECRLCPDGMSCGLEPVSFDTATAKPGYWCEPGANKTNPIYYECRVWSYCLGGATCECADNRAGVLCSVCRSGYHTLPDNSCVECPSTGALSLTYVLGVSSAVLLLMTIVYAGVLADDRFLMVEIKKQFLSQRKLSTDLRQSTRISTLGTLGGDKEPTNEFFGNEEDLANMDTRSPVTSRTQQALLYKRRPKLMGQLKIILGFFQITSHLTRALAVPWPQTYLAFMSFFSVLRVDLLSVIPASCLGQLDYYNEFTFVALLPLLILAVMTCSFLLPRLAKDSWFSASITPEERKTKIDTLVIKWKKLCLFTLFALYPTISVNAAQLFICVDIKRSDGVPVSYLAKDVNLRCDVDQWNTYAAWGVVSLLFYSAGIPLLFFVLLFRNKPNFSENKVRYQLGFVYEAYAPNIWFFEIVDMCHKFLLTCFIFLVGASSQVQLILGMLFCMSYLVIILLGNPYLRPTDDRLHKLAQVLIFLLLLAALNKQQAQNQRVVRTLAQENADEVLGSTFLITVTVAILVVLLYQVLFILRVGIKRVLNRVRNKQEEQIPTLSRRKTNARASIAQSESRDAEAADDNDSTSENEKTEQLHGQENGPDVVEDG